MTLYSKVSLKFAAAIVSAASCTAFAQTLASNPTLITPIAASARTTVPALVPYSGIAVSRDGHALNAETGITFLIYKNQSGDEPLFTETQTVVPDATGRYTVYLGASKSSGIPVDLFSSGEARWLEVQITGEPIQPRTLLASVPFALKAADATTLGGLPASAYALAGGNSPGTSRTTAAISPDAATTVTTTGGTSGYLPVFTGAATIADSTIFQTSTGVGIGDTPHSGFKLDINGATIVRGALTIPDTAGATATKGYPSYPFGLYTSVYNSSTKANVNPIFYWEAEPAGNNTTAPSATMNLLYNSNLGTGTETGLHINSNGTIAFAAGQTFPGAGGTSGSPVCIATGGGFGSGGTTFVGPSFTVPAGGGCNAWSGFTKTASTVVLTTSGGACLSSDGKKLTLSVSSADPNYLGAGTMASDYIQLSRASTTGSFTSGTDQGEFSGSAVQVTCTTSLLQLNENND